MVVRVEVVHTRRNGGVKAMIQRLEALKHKGNIYVGIPQQNASRPGSEINNAELLYIHTHGIRRRSMIQEMDRAMNNQTTPMKYSDAFSLYVMTHGSPLWHSPPRPVLEPAIKYNRKKIAAEYAKIITATAKDDRPGVLRAIHKTGFAAENAARDWFKNPANGWPKNADSTIAAKGSDSPLIDTGTLRKAIVYVVRDE